MHRILILQPIRGKWSFHWVPRAWAVSAAPFWSLVLKRLSPHLGALEPVSVALIVRVLPPTRRVRSSEPFARTLPAQKELVFSFTLVGCSAPSQSCPPNRSLPIFCLYSQLSSTHTDAHICTTHTMGYVFTLDLERYPSPLSTMDELPSHWCLSKDIEIGRAHV